MRCFILCVILSLSAAFSDGQNLVGYKAGDIMNYLDVNRRDLQSITVSNNVHKYLKYTDVNDNQTLLFFLSADSVCRNIRMIFDPSLKSQKLKELDSTFKRIGNSQWTDNRNGMDYIIKSLDEQWSFVVTIVQKE